MLFVGDIERESPTLLQSYSRVRFNPAHVDMKSMPMSSSGIRSFKCAPRRCCAADGTGIGAGSGWQEASGRIA